MSGYSLILAQKIQQVIDCLGGVRHEILNQVRIFPAYLSYQLDCLLVHYPTALVCYFFFDGLSQHRKDFGISHQSSNSSNISSLALRQCLSIEKGVEMCEEPVGVCARAFELCEQVLGCLQLVFVEGGQQLLEGPLLFVHDIIINRHSPLVFIIIPHIISQGTRPPLNYSIDIGLKMNKQFTVIR